MVGILITFYEEVHNQVDIVIIYIKLYIYHIYKRIYIHKYIFILIYIYIYIYMVYMILVTKKDIEKKWHIHAFIIIAIVST